MATVAKAMTSARRVDDTARQSVRLTTAQRARVRELMADEGESRESAEAWVRTFEPPGSVPWSEEPRDCLALALHGRTRGEGP